MYYCAYLLVICQTFMLCCAKDRCAEGLLSMDDTEAAKQFRVEHMLYDNVAKKIFSELGTAIRANEELLVTSENDEEFAVLSVSVVSDFSSVQVTGIKELENEDENVVFDEVLEADVDNDGRLTVDLSQYKSDLINLLKIKPNDGNGQTIGSLEIDACIKPKKREFRCPGWPKNCTSLGGDCAAFQLMGDGHVEFHKDIVGKVFRLSQEFYRGSQVFKMERKNDSIYYDRRDCSWNIADSAPATTEGIYFYFVTYACHPLDIQRGSEWIVVLNGGTVEEQTKNLYLKCLNVEPGQDNGGDSGWPTVHIVVIILGILVILVLIIVISIFCRRKCNRTPENPNDIEEKVKFRAS